MLGRSLPLSFPAALLAGVLVAAVGCTSDDPAPAPTVEATPIRDFEGTALELDPAPFCDRIGATAVEAAVGPDATARHWSSGDPVRMAPGVRDVAHENGCQWTGTTGDRARDVARAWAFVPPVTVRQAGSLVREARKAQGCTPVTAHAFGRPATGTVCTSKGARVASYQGLFGDVWLTCTVTDRGRQPQGRTMLLQRAGDWCVAVAGAAVPD